MVLLLEEELPLENFLYVFLFRFIILDFSIFIAVCTFVEQVLHLGLF